MAQTLSQQHGWFDFYNSSSGRKNDNNAGGKVHDNYPSDHFHVHAQLLLSGCQESLIPDELCIHLLAQICTFLLFPPNQSLLTTGSSAGQWDGQCAPGNLHGGWKEEF